MDWIRKRRKQLGLSQDDLARSLQLEGFDVMRATISHWETRRFMPPMGNPAFVAALARILKMDTLTVLEMSGFQVRIQHAELAERAARLIDTMSEEKQRLALRLVESLLDDTASV